MSGVGAYLGLTSTGGKGGGRRVARRPRAAIALAVAALTALVGCATIAAAPPGPPGAAERAVKAHVEAGLELYESGDFALAAGRFASAAVIAERCGDVPMQRKTVTAECTSWLRARHLAEFSECTARLEVLQQRARRSDPGVNTLIALGAVAGNRPLPALRIPSAVRPVIYASTKESQ